MIKNLVIFLRRRYGRVKSMLFGRRYFVFGDSHTEVFQHIHSNSLIPYCTFKVIMVGGATAQGMRNPNSKTNALNVFRQELNSVHPKSKLIFLLGEVDTGFVIWYRAKKYKESVN